MTTTTAPDVKNLGSDRFAVPFSMVAPGASLIRKGFTLRDVYVDFQSGSNEWLVFTTEGESSIEAWVDSLADGGAVVAEPFEVEVGGASGTAVDAVSEGVEFPLISLLPETQFWAEIDDSIRIYVLDVEGERISIVITTGTENFDSWIGEMEALLATLGWGIGP